MKLSVPFQKLFAAQPPSAVIRIRFGALSALILLFAAAQCLAGEVAAASRVEVSTEATYALLPADPALPALPAPALPVIDLAVLAPGAAVIPRAPDAAQPGPEGPLQAELFRQLRAALPGHGEGVVFDNVTFPAGLDLPRAPWDASFSFRFPQRGVGTVIFNGSIAHEGQAVRRVSGTLTMDRLAQGVQARRIIRRGERVGEGDLVTLRARLSQLPADAFPSVEQLVATAARSELRPGVWITGKMLELPNLIKSRQAVTMRLINGGIRITTKGIAKQNGALGDVIRIENAQSKKEVLGRVVSKDLVEVVF